MAKRQRSSVLNRLAGKTLTFNGKFTYGVEDSLKAMAHAQQGSVRDDLDASVDYLVCADLNSSKSIQKKALALNGKGASIQVIDTDQFRKLAEPTEKEILALIRAGESETYAKIRGPSHGYLRGSSPKHTFHTEDLNAVKLQNAALRDIHFCGCSFVGAELNQAQIRAASDCDFSKATGDSCQFGDVPNCRFTKAKMHGARFDGDFSNADFSQADLEGASFCDEAYHGNGQTKKTPPIGVAFGKSKLVSAIFEGVHLKSPDFRGADLTKATFRQCVLDSATFDNATLRDAVIVGCTLSNADLSNADLTGANLGDSDLTGAILVGANLKSANLRGAKLDGVDLSRAKNYDPVAATTAGAIGPALLELDAVNSQARRIQVSFRLRSPDDEDQGQVGIDSAGLRWGVGVQLPIAPSRRMFRGRGPLTFSGAMLQLANTVGHYQVCFETVDIRSTKSPKGGKELRDLVMRGIVEAFAQEMPPAAELAAATKKQRETEREDSAAERERLKQAKAEAAKQKAKAVKQIAKKIEKAVGKVSDVGSFLKALELRIEKPKIDKATKMLKASGFKLFNDVTDEYVSGVVKSQTDADLVYACRVAHDGQYSCCTQNLNVCGGLRGSICKHLLVLIIGLVQAGELDPSTIDAWIAKTHNVKPELDKENMGAIFIKYKGAEAGEVDWRPTETVPEDYYAL
ncbi:MAG TPA: pentapeptide repeat-containing protein [Lacipirellulaceae bacterium]|nr:pentapeptide repeat-containing protein [Lacipirellulaceae bacterium]